MGNPDTTADLARLLPVEASPARRDVIHALAALGTPAPAAAVASVLIDTKAAEVDHELATLVTQRIVSHADGEYHLPPADCLVVMTALPEDNAATWYMRAAEQLTLLRHRNPRTVADLRVHLAELDALLRAGEPAAAYEIVETVDNVLRGQDMHDLLFERRVGLVDTIGDEHLEMANLNALADLHAHRGDYDVALSCYERALASATARRDHASESKIARNISELRHTWPSA